jgi:ABC-type sugar transport system ATPase subunit
LIPLAAKYIDREVVLGIRPEHIYNEPRPNGSAIAAGLKVEISKPMGSESIVYLKVGSGSLIARIGPFRFWIKKGHLLRIEVDNNFLRPDGNSPPIAAVPMGSTLMVRAVEREFHAFCVEF